MPLSGPLGLRNRRPDCLATEGAKKGKQTRWIAQRSLIVNGAGAESLTPRLLLLALSMVFSHCAAD